MLENQMVDQEAMKAAKSSYDRCSQAPDFIPAFYEAFFEACPEVRPMFANTDFEQQHRRLAHAIRLLLIFPSQSDDEPNVLTRVAERHSRRDANAHPSLYGPFIDSLISTVSRFDPDFTPEIEQAWRATCAKGVAYMQSKH